MSVRIIQDGDVVRLAQPASSVHVTQSSSRVLIASGLIGGVLFEGPYVVIPKVEQQVLGTRDKMMGDDVTVRGVPRYDVSNQYGTTCSIAVEV